MTFRLSILSVLAAACTIPTAFGGDDDRGRPSDRSERGERPERSPHGENPFDEMTPEQQERVRAALKQVWDDPAVQESREKMAAAAAAYRESLRDAIGKTDPEIRDLLDKALRDKFRRGMRGHSGDRGHPLGLPKMEDVPEEFRDRLKALFDIAARDPELKALRERLGKPDGDSDGGESAKRSFERLRELVETHDPDLWRFFRPPGASGDENRTKRD